MRRLPAIRLLFSVSSVAVMALCMAETSSAQNRGYDFSERIYKDVTGGDFYIVQNSFFANNVGQRGIVSIGACSSVDSFAGIPTSGYTRFGVAAVAGNCYVALTHNDERDHIVFRADTVTSAGVSITWKIITSENRGATLSVTDDARRGYDFSERAYKSVTGVIFTSPRILSSPTTSVSEALSQPALARRSTPLSPFQLRVTRGSALLPSPATVTSRSHITMSETTSSSVPMR